MAHPAPPAQRSRRPRSTVLLLGIAATLLIGTGCSKGSPATGSEASADTGSSTARDKAVAFAECMRSNGIAAFPDPDASGSLTIDGVANGGSVDPSSATFTQALTACKDLEPPGFTGHERNAQEQSDALKFAQCVRDHGVADFPDPAPDAPLVNTNLIPSSAGKGGMNALNSAMQTCGDLVASQLGNP